MSLPKGYTEVEYIESSGTQYINTGVTYGSSNTYVIEAKCRVTSDGKYSGWNAGGIFGNQNGYWDCGTSSLGLASTVMSEVKLTINSGSSSQSVIEITQNGETQTQSRAHGSLATYAKMSYPIFAYTNGSGGLDGYASMRLTYMKITVNDTMVRDFVPCINPSGEVGLYDVINGVFYGNNGSGVFTFGKPIGGTVYPLPENFVQVEYIRSSGTQYIDTGFKPNSNTRIVLDYESLSTTTAFVFGSRHNSSANSTSYAFAFVNLNSNSVRSDFGSVESSITGTVLKRVILDKDKNTTTYDGTTVTAASQTFSNSYNLYLCSVNTAGAAGAKASMRIYSCQIYDNGTLVRDFVPCRNSSNEIGLYDFVNGRFYGNAGSGIFTAGNVVILTPSAPSHFSAVSGIGSVFLEWTEAEKADGYRLYRNGVLIADTASTAYTDEGLESYSGVRYELVPYNDSGDGGSVTADVIIKGSPRPLSDLVIDRTAADAATKTRKGVYNAADLNRVSAAAVYVHGLLDELGYASPKTPERVWHVNDIPDRGEMNAHHNAVVGLDVIRYAHEKVVLPPNLEKLTYERANNIEKFLLLCGEAAERIPAAYIYSDEIFGGELS